MSSIEYVVSQVGDLRNGQMKEVTAGETKILLSRIAGVFYAVGAMCPHYETSLAEGVLCGDRVVCPWHKSVFRVTDGALLDPPALDALPRYQVAVAGSDVVVTLPARNGSAAKTQAEADDRHFGIVGAGAAGVAAACALREFGFKGRVSLISQESEPPYDRTKLSKEFLSGNAGPDQLPLRAPEFFEAQKIERVTKRVQDVLAGESSLAFADGTRMQCNALLVAPGSKAKRLPIPGADLGGVFTLRTQADAEAILSAAQPGVRTVVIGGSFIALEVASCFGLRKMPAIVVVPDEAPFANKFGLEVGKIFQAWHEAHGIEFRTTAKVASFAGTGVVREVVLESGERLPADLVIVGVGVAPATEVVKGVEKQDDGGIVVDEFLRAGGAVYVAGDSAVVNGTRIEHWRVAEQHGRTVAANLLGREEAYTGVPYFWTNHFGSRFDYLGHAEEWEETVLQRGDESKPEFISFYLKDGKVAAAVACKRDREIAALHELLRLKRAPTSEQVRAGVDLVLLLGS